MKKTSLLLLFLISVSCIFAFTGCTIGNSVKSISLSYDGESVVIELGKFNYDDYKVNVKYENGDFEEIALNEDMISSYDKLKFYQVGEQTITIKYENCSCDMKIIVQRANLDDVVFEDKVVVYTGMPFTMEVGGNVPADAKVRYPSGNSFTNAGTYNITAICYGDNYETKTLSAILIIEKAEYDMSNVKFENATFDYDRTPKSVSIVGALPEGVTVKYSIGEKEGNTQTNAGKYKVIASFSSKNINYKQIPDKSAILTINKAKYGDFNINFKDKNTVYSGHSNSIDADLSSVPKGVTAYYTIQKIKNAKGEDVESAPESGNSATLAGTYIVSVNFIVTDTENYESIEPRSATLFIDRAVYVIDDAFMYSDSVVYDGSEKSIILSGDNADTQPVLPFGVSVEYTNKLVKDKNGNEVDGEVKSGNSVKNAGTYEVVAHLTSTDENYKEIADIIGILEIRMAEFEDLILSMNDLTVNYDGKSHSISVQHKNLPEIVTIKYTIKKINESDGSIVESPIESEGNSAIEAGTYEICAVFVSEDENYSEISSMTAVLTILEVE